MEARGDRGTGGHSRRHEQGPPAQGPRRSQGGALAMKCVDVEYVLDELVDGSLPEKRRAEALAHLDSCEGCREAERSLRALLAEAAALEKEIEPPRDLWTGIAGRISAGARVA